MSLLNGLQVPNVGFVSMLVPSWREENNIGSFLVLHSRLSKSDSKIDVVAEQAAGAAAGCNWVDSQQYHW